MKVNVAGTGSGEVVTGTPESDTWSAPTPLSCSYDGTNTTGVCENTPEEFTFGKYREWLVANPAPGSEFGGWVVQQGEESNNAFPGCTNGSCGGFTEFCPANEHTGIRGPQPLLECGFASVGEGEANEFEVQATFCTEGTAIEQTGENKYWETSEPLLLGCGSGTPSFELTTEVVGSGEVSGPEGIHCPGGCSASFDEGETVTLTETPGAHAHFVEWTGSGAGGCSGQSTATCEVEMSEAKTVKAVFADNTHTLTVAPSGEGEVSGGPISACSAGGGTCAGSVVEGQTVSLTATPETGWGVASWTGCTPASGNTCEVTVNADATIEVEFAEISGSPLTIFVTGGGSVTADTGTISGCTETGGSACEGVYEGTVTLTETPATGFVFAGWIGCKHKSATECEVAVNAEKEVYAVFIGEGAAGAPGEDGKNIVVGNATTGECPDGGVTVEIEGEPSTKRAICNGHIGEDGEPGERGEIGFPGPVGPQGPPGSSGPAGANGGQGPQGAQGAQGPAGPRGPSGKVKVTCTMKGSAKVVCKVRDAGPSSSKRPKLSWRLMSGGRTQSHGKTTLRRLNRVLAHLDPGAYVLLVDGQRATLVIPAQQG